MSGRCPCGAGIVAGIFAAPPEPRVRNLGMLLICMGLAACYEPSLRNCSVQCDEGDQCLGTQVCVGGYCADPNVSRCDDGQPVVVDARMAATDVATPVDAMPGCTSQNCANGTCIGGVCTIDCSAADSCEIGVTCPADLPCRVICGDASCSEKINCTMASSCKVDCVGTQSCLEEIQCPADRACDVTCSGEGSCGKKVKCGDSCACNITCTGLNSCAETPECPASLCRVANACTSQVAGCNTCQ